MLTPTVLLECQFLPSKRFCKNLFLTCEMHTSFVEWNYVCPSRELGSFVSDLYCNHTTLLSKGFCSVNKILKHIVRFDFFEKCCTYII